MMPIRELGANILSVQANQVVTLLDLTLLPLEFVLPL